MTDKEILDWIDKNQPLITIANHRFYLMVGKGFDSEFKDDIRSAVAYKIMETEADDDGASMHASGAFYAQFLKKE